VQSEIGWTNVHGRPAQPRAATTVKLAGWLRVVSVHAPPGINWQGGHAVGPDQRIKSYGSLAEKLVKLANNTKGAILIGGDWNEGAASTGKWSPSWIAAQGHMKKHARHGIDWEMSRGVVVERTHTGPNGGSDHKIVTFTVSRPQKKQG
jgi:hypothetical protein